ncbi:hypothetical protein [Sediminispirochaeta bajacaliforniensis]|uniref:hypothetical protein n=1 Tax=Sediminispirochaeta bajacaliforniensis TaxID=148 RepID=UPI00036708FC|nr:hypothetical protein [Sediminispirochaeta bajacaliforniensis]
MLKKIKDQFTTSSLVLIPIAVGINLLGNFIASTLKLPVYLDLIGTTIAGAIGGGAIAVAVAVFSSLFQGLFINPIYFPFMIVSVVNALVIGYCAKRGFFRSLKLAIIPWISIVIVSTIVSSFVSIVVFGGVTGATGSSVLTATFMAATKNIVKSVVSSTIIVESLDKGIAVFISAIVLKKIPASMLNQKQHTEEDF